MEKNRYYFSEEFVMKVFQQIENVEIEENLNYIWNGRRNIGDFSFNLNDKKYIVEVKVKFSSALLSRTLSYIGESLYNTNVIIVVLDKIPEKYKNSILNQYDNLKIWDISNILYLIYDDENMQKELNNIIDFSLDNVIPQKPIFEFEPKKKKVYIEKNKKDYIKLLSDIKCGKSQAKEYEKLLEEIIKELFSNDLTLFVSQNRTEDNINIFDMICKIKNDVDDEFFSTIEKFFKSKYILFEFKNYNALIKQGQICTTEKYLFETALRKVAIVITRKGIDKNGKKMISGILRETGKLIIVLNDDDIKTMIELHEKNEKVSMVLSEKLDGILTTLEK